MTRPLRALASLIVALTTVVGMVVYQHYSREPPSDDFTVAVTTAASILAWLLPGLEYTGRAAGRMYASALQLIFPRVDFVNRNRERCVGAACPLACEGGPSPQPQPPGTAFAAKKKQRP